MNSKLVLIGLILCGARAWAGEQLADSLSRMPEQITVVTVEDIFAEVVTVTPVEPIDTHRRLYLAAKTNMLFDALLVPNVAVEAYLGKNWSVGASWMYAWWDKNSTHKYWRIYGGDIFARRWLGSPAADKPLSGHHVGAFVGVNTYDFEFGGIGHMGGYPGHNIFKQWNWLFGIEYGYSLPVARRLNIDFTIGVGYYGGRYYKYKPEYGVYVWQATRRLNWIGPVKAEVSLVWLIGHDNVNPPKGGDGL